MGIREKSLRGEITRAEVELADLRRRGACIHETLAREVTDAQCLRDLLDEEGLNVPASLQTFIEIACARSQSPISDLQSDLEALGHHYAERHALLKSQSDQLSQAAKQLQREIIQLRTGEPGCQL